VGNSVIGYVRVVVRVRVGCARVIALIRVIKLVLTAPSKQRDRLVLYVTLKICQM
jgi:hypothetical protein